MPVKFRQCKALEVVEIFIFKDTVQKPVKWRRKNGAAGSNYGCHGLIVA
jgi:hypothetical protein